MYQQAARKALCRKCLSSSEVDRGMDPNWKPLVDRFGEEALRRFSCSWGE